MTPKFAYQLRNLVKQYQKRTILKIDYLNIYQGEILALVGPSGAGKSTLLRLLNFLERPTKGDLTFEQMQWTDDQPPLAVRRKVTTVFQKPALLNRSVSANVTYALGLRGHRKRGSLSTTLQVLKQVGLQELAHASARTLSGGEAQRVALARALIVEPTVLLLDEPTANLDPYNIQLIEAIITNVNHQQNTTIVLVTHNLFQAKRLAHRTALMLEGHLIEVANTHTFFNAPTNAKTAAFLRGELVFRQS